MLRCRPIVINIAGSVHRPRHCVTMRWRAKEFQLPQTNIATLGCIDYLFEKLRTHTHLGLFLLSRARSKQYFALWFSLIFKYYVRICFENIMNCRMHVRYVYFFFFVSRKCYFFSIAAINFVDYLFVLFEISFNNVERHNSLQRCPILEC